MMQASHLAILLVHSNCNLTEIGYHFFFPGKLSLLQRSISRYIHCFIKVHGPWLVLKSVLLSRFYIRIFVAFQIIFLVLAHYLFFSLIWQVYHLHRLPLLSASCGGIKWPLLFDMWHWHSSIRMESLYKQKVSLDVTNVVFSLSSYAILIWLYPENPSMNEYVTLFAALSTKTSMWVRACLIQVSVIHTHPDPAIFLGNYNYISHQLRIMDHIQESCIPLFLYFCLHLK